MTGAGGGIALYSLGVLLFAVNDALGKWLVGTYGVGEILALRSLGAAAVLVPLLALRRPDLDIRDQWRLHALRLACMAGDSFGFYYATRSLPLADVMCFYLAAPLIITTLSALLLGERIGAFRWGAVLLGFCGVVIALRPTGAAVSPAALVALFGATMFAGAITTTRGLRRTDWLTLTAWQYLGTGLFGAVLAPAGWATPSAFDVLLMGLVGAVSMGCFVCITRALAMAPASLLAPFQYASMVWAAVLGLVIWGDVPGSSVVAGSAIIVASGLVVFARERMRGRPLADAVAPVP
ncbi:DMT family transporter [Lichenibacterium ramalinae]|nr:DMT family transporter [Lichenibacterium ramalinae]